MARQMTGIHTHLGRRSSTYAFLMVVLIMGTVSGAFAVKTLSPGQNDELLSYIQNFFQAFPVMQPNDPLTNARLSFLGNITKTIGLMWLLGLSVLGAPFILALVFLRGFVLGFTVAFLVQEMVFRGIILALASVLPHNLLLVPGIILAGGASFAFSWAALQTLLGRRDINMYRQFANTALLVLLACICMGLAALVEAYITPGLIETVARYFN